jgi:hypothetical protein
MSSKNNIWDFEEWVVRRNGFIYRYINSRSSDQTLLQSLDEGTLIYAPSPGSIYKVAGALHLLEFPIPDHIACFGGQGRMETDKIRIPEECI